MRTQFSKIAFVAGFVLALGFTFGCSDDSPSGPSGGGNEQSYKYCITANGCLDGPFTASTCNGQLSNGCPNGSSSSSVTGGNVPSSSSSVIVGTQYYDVMLGYWSASCPSLNDYPELLNNVISMNDDSRSFMEICLIEPEYYTQNTGSQIANFLTTNGLSRYANEFDSRIAASPYNAAYLIYINTSNYFRILIIGYSGTNLPSSSSSSTPTPSTCNLGCVEGMVGSIATYTRDFCKYGMSIFSAETLLRIYDTCGCMSADVSAEVAKLCK